MSWGGSAVAQRALIDRPGSIPGGRAFELVSSVGQLPAFCLLGCVILLFPSGKVVSLPGTAGPKGWAHIKYTVPTKATKGSNHKVTVLARPFNNPKLSSRTTFTIK